MQTVKLFSGTSGLNTKIDPTRAPFSPEVGIPWLATAKNVMVDDSGRISRIKGYSKKLSGSFHSLYHGAGMTVAVTGDALSIIHQDFTRTPIRNITPHAQMSYVTVDGKIFYANGFEIGYIENELSAVWAYHGPRPGANTDREFSSPPIGDMVQHYKGRMLMAAGDTIWYSEPYDFSAFDYARNFLRFENRVTMILPVDSGIYVSDEKDLFFLHGDASKESFFVKRKLFALPAIKGTGVQCQGQIDMSNPEEPKVILGAGGMGVLFLNAIGICYGDGDGRLVNVSHNKIGLPKASSGCSFVDNGIFYTVLNP